MNKPGAASFSPRLVARLRPFYAVGEDAPYRMYHDLDSLPIPVW